MDLIRQELEKYETAELSEFFLPRDMPHFCNGCFSCIYNGEDTCPHAASVQPIIKAVANSDILILTSPVYAFDVSGQMKAFLDHLSFMWMSHRPNPNMFNKIGLTITTAAGMGLGHTTKTMKYSLTYWGVKKVFSFKTPVSAMKWSDVSDKRQARIRKDIKKLAARIIKSYKNIRMAPNPIFRSILFRMMALMQRKNDWNLSDRAHWEKNGWLAGSRPF
jgi:multimeric flavodoxin WrbA